MRQAVPTPALGVRHKRNCTRHISRSVVGLDAGLASRAHMLVFNVQRTQLHNERTVEKIVRERSANGMNLASLALAPVPFWYLPSDIVSQLCKRGASILNRRAQTLRPNRCGLRRRDSRPDYIIQHPLFLDLLPCFADIQVHGYCYLSS